MVVLKSDKFEIRQSNLVTKVNLKLQEAIFGTMKEIATVEGTEFVEIEQGSSATFSKELKGKVNK